MIEELRQQFFTYLVDSGFVQISETERRELSNIKSTKSRVRFMRVPAELDARSKDPKTIMGCLASAMYPKLLVIDPSGQPRTLTNNAPAAIHPSSVNFNSGRRPDWGKATLATYFNIMQSKRLCACLI
jgi:ATP-dependent RNA helicase DHX29